MSSAAVPRPPSRRRGGRDVAGGATRAFGMIWIFIFNGPSFLSQDRWPLRRGGVAGNGGTVARLGVAGPFLAGDDGSRMAAR